MMSASLAEEIARLNPQQREAVQAIDGRVLVLAGAGSGKTRVLTTRIAHLVLDHGVEPEEILGLTFTNKAAGEMRERLAQMIGPGLAGRVLLSTFHSFCMRVLREHIDRLGYTKQFTLYDAKDMERLVAAIVRDELRHEGELPSLAPVMHAIAQARNQGADIADVLGTKTEWQEEFHSRVYARLQESMRAHNALDFDSLLWLTVRLLHLHDDVRQLYQERYRYLLIDEYQDTNPVQAQISTLISQHHSNLFVVGDDDQSIYGWRGADVKNILEFDNALLVRLEQNYRSTNTILRAANAVIKQNSERHSKELWSDKGDGQPIKIFVAPSEVDEAEAVVARLVKLKAQAGLRWSDIAILYRSNALSRQLETALMRFSWQEGSRFIRGVPYHIHGGTEFFERKEVKDLLCYLRVMINRNDQQALLRIINLPRRGIGEKVLDTLTQINRNEGVPLWDLLRSPPTTMKLSARAKLGLEQLVTAIEGGEERFRAGNFQAAANWLLETINYEQAIQEDVKSDKMRTVKRENVGELVSALAQFDEQEEEPTLQDFVLSTPLGTSEMQEKQRKETGEDSVTLMTLHSSKGLEFEACFLVGIEERIIPHERSLAEGGLEEERRLMYVALTRAKQYLTLSMAKVRRKHGESGQCRPSRFLFEIPQELLKTVRWDSP